MDQPSINSDLLALYLAGEASEEQRLLVDRWIAEAQDNALEFQRMQRIWDLSADPTDLRIDEGAAFEKLMARITTEEERGKIIPIGRVRWTTWIAAAAMIAGLIFAARLFWRAPAPEVLMAGAAPIEATLTDRSRVVLSAGSKMEVVMEKQRRVQLTGKAYFEVQHDEQRPFIVGTGDVMVTVLGTAFTVSAYDTSEFVVVRVREGVVRMAGGDEVIELRAGEQGRFHRKRHFLERAPGPPAEVWGLRILQFEEATLHQVAEQLQQVYDVQIDVRTTAIGNCRYTAEFDDEPIATIMNVIAETFGLQLEQLNAKHFILDGEGCE